VLKNIDFSISVGFNEEDVNLGVPRNKFSYVRGYKGIIFYCNQCTSTFKAKVIMF
jgi:hypothetical protein